VELRIYPDRILRASCLPVREVSSEDIARMEQMLELMYRSEGVGLAGPQAGWASRVLTVDVEGERTGERIFLNPRILSSEGAVVEEEGCLSLPGLRAPVVRAERIVIAAYTVHGERIERELEGLHARVWQHEIDHLNGILFIDRLEPTTLVSLRQALRELEQAAGEGAGRQR